MSKITIFLLVVSVLIGCGQLQTNPESPKSLMKWAMVDKNKLDKSVMEYIKKINPVPVELSNEEELRQSRSKIERQISEIESDASKKCVTANTENDKKTNSVEKLNHSAYVAGSPPIINREGGININGHYVPLSAINTYPKVINQDNYRECLSNISQDPLVADLREQANKLDKIRLERNRYEDETRKKAAEYTSDMLAKYADANRFELIVSNNHGNANILYNAEKISLDVTDDVLDFIAKTQESTLSESE